MKIQSVIFDFDGVILDTEQARYDAWEAIYQSFGHTLPVDIWIKSIGRSKYAVDPFELLQKLTGKSLDTEKIRDLQRTKSYENVRGLPLLPGVKKCILEAVALKLKVGIASSSSRIWVQRHLKERGLLKYFDVLVCKEDTDYHKPSPFHYLTALKKLNCSPDYSVAIEDSPLGIESAIKSGMYCIAVACNLTKNMDLSGAHRIEESLQNVSFARIMNSVDKKIRNGAA